MEAFLLLQSNICGLTHKFPSIRPCSPTAFHSTRLWEGRSMSTPNQSTLETWRPYFEADPLACHPMFETKKNIKESCKLHCCNLGKPCYQIQYQYNFVGVDLRVHLTWNIKVMEFFTEKVLLYGPMPKLFLAAILTTQNLNGKSCSRTTSGDCVSICFDFSC